MRRISGYLANYEPPSSGFSEGKLLDNPGDDTGSGITVQTHNDLLYGFYALIKKYKTGGLSDTAESETNSDVIAAIEEMMGLRVDTVSDWSSATTYSVAGTSVMRRGIQFVCINTTGNLNKDPLLYPGYWMAVPSVASLFEDFSHGRVIRGEASPLHDYNGSLYQQYFKLGLHKVGGASGQVFQAYGVHLDGNSVTPSGTLDTILTGYFLQTIFAPGTPKVLKDARGTVDRAIDATGGNCPTMGERIEDAMHGHKHDKPDASNNYLRLGATYSLPAGTGGAGSPSTGDPITDGVHGVPRVASETRPKSITTGVPYFVVMVAL